MKISKHVAYSEVIHSDTASRKGIENIPSIEQLVSIKELAINIFEPLRRHFKVPIYISSGFRSAKLNKALKGANNSQHLANNGAAFDLDADRYGKITNTDIFSYILDNLEFDQLIAEFEDNGQPRWIHVSYKCQDNRKQVLIAYKNRWGVHYMPYTKEEFNKIYNII
jgi:predicted RecB family nuclease